MFAIPRLLFDYSPHVMITTEALHPVYVTLSIASHSIEINRTISRNNGTDVELPHDIRVNLRDGKQNKTIIVRASDVVSVYALTNKQFEGDAFQSIQTSQLGKKYYVASYRPYATHVSSFVCVSAVNSNTSVSISTQSGLEHVFLQQYESYRYDGRDYQDLSGTLVQSDKPIAVISGSTSLIGSGTASGILSQLKPTESWGNVYYIFPFKELTSGFVYRVFASDKTTLDMSDDGVIIIQSGEFYENDVSGNSIVSFQSDQKVMVVQYMKSYHAGNNWGGLGRGDPSMVVVQPVSLYTNNVTFPVFEYTRSGHTYYINVVTECENVDGLVFDDSTQAASWDMLTTNDQTMCCVRSNVTSGYHSITHANQTARFSVSVYAICNGCTSSYAYAATGIPAQGRYFEFILHHYSCHLLNCE